MNGKRKVCATMAQMKSWHCAKSRYYEKRIGVNEEALCEKCKEEEGKGPLGRMCS